MGGIFGGVVGVFPTVTDSISHSSSTTLFSPTESDRQADLHRPEHRHNGVSAGSFTTRSHCLFCKPTCSVCSTPESMSYSTSVHISSIYEVDQIQQLTMQVTQYLLIPFASIGGFSASNLTSLSWAVSCLYLQPSLSPLLLLDIHSNLKAMTLTLTVSGKEND